MAYFNVLKGAYPSLQQIDKTLAVASDATDIVRGSCVYVDGSGDAPVWKLATGTQATDATAYIYFALISQDDFQAGMAGTIGQGPAAGVARITALAVGMPMEFETDQFDDEETFAVSDLLTVGADGKLVLHTSGDNVVAQVTKAVALKWVNNAVAVVGRRTGAEMSVLTARTMWVPVLVTA